MVKIPGPATKNICQFILRRTKKQECAGSSSSSSEHPIKIEVGVNSVVKRERRSLVPISCYSRRITVHTCLECRADFSNMDRLKAHMRREGHSHLNAEDLPRPFPLSKEKLRERKAGTTVLLKSSPRCSDASDPDISPTYPDMASPFLPFHQSFTDHGRSSWDPIPAASFLMNDDSIIANHSPCPATTPRNGSASGIPSPATNEQPGLSASIMDLINPIPIPRTSSSETGLNPPPSTATIISSRSKVVKKGRRAKKGKSKKKSKSSTTHRCHIDGCGEERPTKYALQNHLEIHCGKKPFMCPVCRWAYETEIKLLEHYSIRHSEGQGEAIFSCDQCEKSYKTERGLGSHRLLKHSK